MQRLLPIVAVVLVAACDKSGPLAGLDASSTWVAAPPTSASGSPIATDAAAPAPRRIMPPRPVPTTNPTVTITMPVETQLQAIQYMAAMQAPQPGDAPADPTYAKGIAEQLRAVGHPDVISSGRVIDVKVETGCDATMPREAIARHTGATLGVLLAHGMLVVRCTDRKLQCLQSTRGADDVLCVHK